MIDEGTVIDDGTVIGVGTVIVEVLGIGEGTVIAGGTVRPVATLARLGLSPGPVPGLVTDLNAFLGLIAGLERATLESATASTAHGPTAAWRADELKAPIGAARAVAGAPGGQGDVFLVPKVVT